MKTKILFISLLLVTLFSGCTYTIVDAGMFNDNQIQDYIDEGVDVNLQDQDGDTALINSVLFGNFDNVKRLLENGAKVDLRNNDGETALLNIVLFDKPEHEKILKLLLKKGAKIDAVDNENYTALMNAIRFAHLNKVKMLLESGAEVNRVGEEHQTPLFELCLGDDLETTKSIVRLLLDHGADINAKDSEGDTIADYDGCKDNATLMWFLKSKGLN